MVSKRTEELLKFDAEHIIHPMAMVGGSWGGGVVLERGEGVKLYDTEGNEYIDIGSMQVCNNLGHGRRELIDAAIEQLNKLQFSDLFWGRSNVPNIECSQKLAEIVPEGLDHFHFVSGGSEALDTAIKTARLHWNNVGEPGKYKIISLYEGYHGSTGISMHLTSIYRGFMEARVSTQVPGYLKIAPYYCYRCPYDMTYPECKVYCARYLQYVIENEGRGSVAAFLAEGMIGSEGHLVPPPEWWPTVRKICTNNNVLLIADEVMSGFCRTGKMWAIEHWNVIPDIITMAKGITGSYIPFGAVAVNDTIHECMKGKVYPHGMTFSGHNVGSAVSAKAIEVYQKEKVAENAAKVGKHVMERLEAEFMPLPCVGTISGLGLFIGIELVADKNTKATLRPLAATNAKIQEEALKAGLFMRDFGGVRMNRLFFTPPCTITMEEADQALDLLYPIVANLKPGG